MQTLAEKKITIKLSELILDFEFYPRSRINPSNVARLKESLLAGDTLPPILVDEDTKIIIDGFHRYTAYRELYGEDYECDITFKRYKNQGEMLIDIGKINSRHGRPLIEQDKERFIIMAEKMGVGASTVAHSLAITPGRVRKLYGRRIARDSGNPETKERVKQSKGATIEFYASRIMHCIRYDKVDFKDEATIKILQDLYKILKPFMED